MKSKLALFIYLFLLLGFGYHCIDSFLTRESSNDPLAVVVPFGYLLAIVVISFWFTNAYPDIRKRERLKRWLSFVPNVPILFVKFRPACALRGDVIEMNYRRFLQYPEECRVFMLLWCNHMRAINMAVGESVDALNDIVLVLRADRQAFHSYISLGFDPKYIERYFFKNQFNLGKYDPDRFKEMRKLVNMEWDNNRVN